MPETRYTQEYDDQGNVINRIPYEVSDEQLLFEQLEAECNSQHTKGVQAYNNWGSLTLAQKDVVLKELLGAMLSVLRSLGYFVI